MQIQELKENQRFLFTNSFLENSITEVTIIENVNDYVKLQYVNNQSFWIKTEDWNKEYKILKLLESKEK